ncbi:MAG TPA: amidase family protein, partial [Kiritimatiellia bacterium]|nr:amidase family protein [Kiritimatiellia bacterium]
LFTFLADRKRLEKMAKDLFKVVADGTVKIPITGRYKLADAEKAHRDLQGRETTGMVILTEGEMGAGSPEIRREETHRAARDLKGLKLGLPKEYFVDGLHPEVEQLTRAAVAQCRALGAEIVDVELPHSKYGIACYYVLAPAEASANLARYDGVRYGFRAEAEDLQEMYEQTRAQGFGAEVKRRVILGTYVLSSGFHDAYYLRAQKVRTLIRRDFDRVFARCDAILGPVTPSPAFRVGEKTADPVQMYLGDIFTANVNLAGICGLSVPCGFTTGGLPAGLHIIGPAFADARILQIGAAYQHATEWHKQQPKI